MLFNTLGAPSASSLGPTCTINCGTTSAPQAAGLVTMGNSPQLLTSLPLTIAVTCPAGHGSGGTGTGGLTNGACRSFSYPLLYNDVFWQNRSFYIGVGSLGTGTQNQQNVVALYNAFTTNRALSQPLTGACVTASYWDIGVRGDTGPSNHSSGLTLAPVASILTSIAGYPGTAANPNLPSDPGVVSQYCDGSRVPPENGGLGYQVPAGISDATVPNPIFNLTPAATVDEGNNWINISWGPLALTNPVTGAVLGNYVPTSSGSGTVDKIPFGTAAYVEAPTFDFFGTRRKGVGTIVTPIDIGAVEFATTTPAPTLTSIAPTSGARGTSVPVTLTGTNLAGATAVNVSGTGVTVGALTVTPTTITTTLTITYTATLGARTVSITTPGGTSNTVTFTVVAGTLSFTSATNGTLASVLGVRTLTFAIPTLRAAVTSVVTVTNTGAAPLQITAENLLVNIGGLYTVPANSCSFTTPLAVGGTCTFSVRYATPATLPGVIDVGALAVRNNGTGTIAIPPPAYTPLALVAR